MIPDFITLISGKRLAAGGWRLAAGGWRLAADGFQKYYLFL